MAERPKSPDARVAPMFGSVARGKVVAIAVGPQKKLYYIHKDLICHHSEYFRTAYSGRWKDSDEGVALEDVEVEVFNIFVHWLYAQDLPRNMASVPRIAEVNVSLVSPRRKPASYSDWCPLMLKSSAFGNRFLAREFQRLTHNMFVDGHFMDDYDEYTVSNYKDIIWAFDNLAADNPILSLMVDLQCLEWDEKYDNAEERLLWPRLPHEFLLRVMRKHGKLSRQNRAKVVVEACSYHLHATPEEKEACVWHPVDEE